MGRIRLSPVLVALAIASAVLVASAPAQRRKTPLAPAEGPTVPLTIALAVGTTQYAFSGQGTCEATDKASIYGMPAALWTVRSQDRGNSLALSFWRPSSNSPDTKGSPDMVSLAVTVGGRSHRVNTVRVGGKGEVEGSANVTFDKDRDAGIFKIEATSSDGAKIKGMIRCSSFSSPAPVAG